MLLPLRRGGRRAVRRRRADAARGRAGLVDRRRRRARPRSSSPTRYALLDFATFRDGLQPPATAADDALGKLGLTQDNGVLYYLWTFTWGLGWVAAGGGVAGGLLLLAATSARAASVLAPGADPLPALHGLAGALLRALADAGLPAGLPAGRLRDRSSSADSLARRRPALRPTLVVLGVVALCGQGLVYSLHIGQVLSRGRHAQHDARLAGRPTCPRAHRRSSSSRSSPTRWASDVGRPDRGRPPTATAGSKFPTSRVAERRRRPAVGARAGADRQHRGLRADAAPRARSTTTTQQGYCWVVVGSTQRGRAEAEPEVVPRGAGLLPRARAPLDARLRGLALPQGRRAREVQLRLVLRLLPAGLPAARAA